MGALLLGILLVLIGWLVPLPYPLGLILVIVGAVLIVYGLYVLFVGTRGPRDGTRRVRWY